MSDLIELVILGPKSTAARCRTLDGEEMVTFRCGSAWTLIPGEIATVRVGKRWRHGRTDYISGAIERTRLDIAALGLTPLELRDPGVWDPNDRMEDEEQVPSAARSDQKAWSRRVLAAGPRPSAEMEQVLPGVEPDDFDSDPICDASEVANAGHTVDACQMLGALLTVDLRCLDAHAHLGNFKFDVMPEQALRHYEVGIAIGDLSLPDPELVLPWTSVDNRPFLRCLNGYGLRCGNEAERTTPARSSSVCCRSTPPTSRVLVSP